jgi:hypothetical protein
VSLQALGRAVGWTLVAGACLAGLRWVAALGTVIGFAVEAVRAGQLYGRAGRHDPPAVHR